LKSTLNELKDVQSLQGKVIEATVASDAERAKLQRKWAETDVINLYDKRERNRRAVTSKTEMEYCDAERERRKGLADHEYQLNVFPTQRMVAEDDGVNCVLMNRDNIVNAYCSFRKYFDQTLQQHGHAKRSKDFWPNLCCASELGDCKPPHEVQPIDMVPFALAQGGKPTRDSLWQEVHATLRQGGHLHRGMRAAVKHLGKNDKLMKRVNTMFSGINLCGPHLLNSPQNSQVRLCQLFRTYERIFHVFHEQVKALLGAQDVRSVQPKTRRRLLAHMYRRSEHSRASGPVMMKRVMQQKTASQATMKTQINDEAAQIKQLTAKTKAQAAQIKSLQENDAQVKDQAAKATAQLTAKINALAAPPATTKTTSCKHIDRSIQFNSERKFRDVQADLCGVPNLDLTNPEVTNVAVIFIAMIHRFKIRDHEEDILDRGLIDAEKKMSLARHETSTKRDKLVRYSPMRWLCSPNLVLEPHSVLRRMMNSAQTMSMLYLGFILPFELCLSIFVSTLD